MNVVYNQLDIDLMQIFSNDFLIPNNHDYQMPGIQDDIYFILIKQPNNQSHCFCTHSKLDKATYNLTM